MFNWIQFRIHEVGINVREICKTALVFCWALSWKTKVDLLRCTLAFVLTISFVFIYPISRVIGSINYFMPISVVQFPPVSNVGATIEKVLALAVVLALTFCYLVAVAAVQTALNSYYAVPDFQTAWWSLICMFVGVFILSMCKIVYPRLVFPFTDGLFMVVVALTTTPNETSINFQRFTLIMWPLMLGMGVVAFIALTVFPQTAHSEFKRGYYSAALDIKDQFHKLVLNFVDTSPDSNASVTDGSSITNKMTMLSTLRLSMRYEFYFSRFTRPGFRKSVHDMRIVVQHLNGIRSVTEAKQSLIEKHAHAATLDDDISPSSPDSPEVLAGRHTTSHQASMPGTLPGENSTSLKENETTIAAANRFLHRAKDLKPVPEVPEGAAVKDIDTDIFDIVNSKVQPKEETKLASMVRVKSLAPVLERMKSQKFQHAKKASLSHQQQVAHALGIGETDIPNIIIETPKTPPRERSDLHLASNTASGGPAASVDPVDNGAEKNLDFPNKQQHFKALRQYVGGQYDTIKLQSRNEENPLVPAKKEKKSNMDLLMATSSSLRRRPGAFKEGLMHISSSTDPTALEKQLLKSSTENSKVTPILVKNSTYNSASRESSSSQMWAQPLTDSKESKLNNTKATVKYGEPLNKPNMNTTEAPISRKALSQSTNRSVLGAFLSGDNNESSYTETLSVSRSFSGCKPNTASAASNARLASSGNPGSLLTSLQATSGFSRPTISKRLIDANGLTVRGTSDLATAANSFNQSVESRSEPDEYLHRHAYSEDDERHLSGSFHKDNEQLTMSSVSLPFKVSNKKHMQEVLKRPIHILEPMHDVDILFPMIDAFSQPVLRLAQECEYVLEAAACFIRGQELPKPPNQSPTSAGAETVVNTSIGAASQSDSSKLSAYSKSGRVRLSFPDASETSSQAMSSSYSSNMSSSISSSSLYNASSQSESEDSEGRLAGSAEENSLTAAPPVLVVNTPSVIGNPIDSAANQRATIERNSDQFSSSFHTTHSKDVDKSLSHFSSESNAEITSPKVIELNQKPTQSNELFRSFNESTSDKKPEMVQSTMPPAKETMVVQVSVTKSLEKSANITAVIPAAANASEQQIIANTKLTKAQKKALKKERKKSAKDKRHSQESSLGHSGRRVTELLGHFTGYFSDEKNLKGSKRRPTINFEKFQEADSRVFAELSSRLADELEVYQQMHWKKVQNFYNLNRTTSSEEGLGEELAMIYFFAYSLQEFTKALLQMMNRLTSDMDPSGKSIFRWPHYSDWETVFDPTRVWMGLKRSQFTNKFMYNKGTTWQSTFTYWSHLFILKMSNALKSYEFKFAFKCAVVCMLIAIPANISASSSAFFTKYRLNWILITTVLVIQPTVGGSIYVSLYRVLGTIAGAVYGYILALICHNNPYFYTCMCGVYCLPWFYLMLRTSHIRLGMTALLTTPVVLATDYNQYFLNFNPSPQSALSIFVQRLVCTLIGIMISVILSMFVWPVVIHVKLRSSLASTIFSLAYVYSHIIALRMTMDPQDKPKTIQSMNKAMDKIQRVISMHDTLITLADHEFAIKQPFDTNIFIGLNLVCQDILTQLTCFSSLLSADFDEQFFHQVIWPVNVYRRDVYAAITVNFHVISNALATKSPLPPYLPNIRAARHQLLAKLRTLPAMQPSYRTHTKEDHSRFLYFYAYAMALREISYDIQLLAALSKELVGEDDYMKVIFERDD